MTLEESTIESQVARDIAINFECKKDGLRQNQDGGCKFTVNIHPDDMPLDLFKHQMGQRYVIALVPLDEDDSPLVKPTEKPKSYAGQAAMMVKDPEFMDFLNAYIYTELDLKNEDEVDRWLKGYLGIESKSQIVSGTLIYGRFKDIQKDFLQWKQLNEQAARYDR